MTGNLVFLLNSVEFAPSIPQTLRANSITAHCKPKQIPKNGIKFSRANCEARIFPSAPLEPKPGRINIPSTPEKAIFAALLFLIFSVCIHFISTRALFSTPACTKASSTLL